MKDKKVIRYKIAQLVELKKQGLMDDEKIELLRKQGQVIEKRKKEIRVIKGTNLSPKFYFKNPLNEPIVGLAYDLKVAIMKAISNDEITEAVDVFPKLPEQTELLMENNKSGALIEVDKNLKPIPKKKTTAKK